MSASADRNLLFGILAVQLDFISKDALIAAMNAWLLDKNRSLGEILREQAQLSADRLELLEALVAEHLKQHGDDPQKSLAALPTIEPAVRRELQSLADRDVRASVAAAAPGRAVPHATPDLPLSPPSRYEILRLHARGGLGEVFVAEDQELHREVALKEIQARHADDPHNRARFLLEAEITGGLEHPGVVPVYGLGAYGDGRPFYAMRFVRGDNLQQAIRRFHGDMASGLASVPHATLGVKSQPRTQSQRFESLEFRQLLRRFLDVCNAVAYAHSRGVLHRDLKPGNVMLGKYGETLVVDWGLAKVTGRDARDWSDNESTLRPHSGSHSSPTVLGKALGTPAYMSPEQAAGRWEDLGPATDVYSLGATLYELLTGRVAFVETEPDAVEKGLFQPPRRLAPAVPRALEAVCLKAMALRASDRYPSALALAADVEHWLADEPVTAYREPLSARAWRWQRRHRTQTAMAAVSVLALAAVLGVLAVERERARAAVVKEQAETARERDRALAARQRTREALDAMVSGVTGNALATQRAISPEQKKFLENVLKYYEEFATETGEDREGLERLANAHYRLGVIRYRLGQHHEATVVLHRAVSLWEHLATQHPDVLEYRRNLARIRSDMGVVLSELGKPAEAEAAYRAALALQEKLIAEYPAVAEVREELATIHSNLATLLIGVGKLPEAEAAHRTALAIRQKLAADHPAVPEYRQGLAHSHNNIGNLLSSLGKPAEAAADYRAAVALQEKLVADQPAVPAYRQELATSQNNLGILLAGLGKKPEAEAAYRTAVALQEKLIADYPAVPEYRRDLARSFGNLGLLLAGLGKEPEAESVYRAALALQEKLAGDYPAVPEYRQQLASSQSNLGLMLIDLGKLPEAEGAYRAAVALQEKLAADYPAVPEYRHDLAHSDSNLGFVLAGLGKRSEAESVYRAALALQEKLAADYPAVPAYRQKLARSRKSLGKLLADMGKLREAESDYRAALALQEKLAANYAVAPEFHEELVDSRLRLAELLAGSGDQAGAVSEAEKSAAGKGATADQVYNAACVLALSSAAVKDDTALANRYAARAVELLRQAFAQGYADVAHMLKDTDLDPLRSRPNYHELLWDLADHPPSADRPDGR